MTTFTRNFFLENLGKEKKNWLEIHTIHYARVSEVVGGRDSSRKAKDYFKGLLQGLINHNWAHVLSMK